ncbi:hypothetical protein [Roseovarius sp. SYSU LYC5161]|uniref:hypothetical protein n=1 Tax=Roseovarius halophilus (ex Wu et al. 2025) TaxID=3376060 RepID=UPI00399B49FE
MEPDEPGGTGNERFSCQDAFLYRFVAMTRGASALLASNTLPVQTKPSRCATCVNASRNPLTELETLFGRDVSSPRHAFLYATSNVGT